MPGGNGLYKNDAIGSRIMNLVNYNLLSEYAEIRHLRNPTLDNIAEIIDQMFDVSGGKIELSTKFKNLICDTVNNYCPYYCSGDTCVARGVCSNNFNSSDNDVSFFHEEVISDCDFADSNYSIFETTDTNDNEKISHNKTYLNFINKSLSSDELLINNNLKIISIEKIKKGKWLLNGNISIEIPKNTQMDNLKLFIYLDGDIIPSGELDLGSFEKSNFNMIKSFPFNLIFLNNLMGRELKIGLSSIGNDTNIKLLRTTNFFLTFM